jgi:hypothetical protein
MRPPKHRGKKLQESAIAHKEKTGVRPVASDLWLVNRRGKHRFMKSSYLEIEYAVAAERLVFDRVGLGST